MTNADHSTKMAVGLKPGDIIERTGWDMAPELVTVVKIFVLKDWTDVTYESDKGSGVMTVRNRTTFIVHNMTEVK